MHLNFLFDFPSFPPSPRLAAALLAARQWRAIAWAAGGTLVLHALTTLPVGLDYWRGFFETLSWRGEICASLPKCSDGMVTWFAALQAAGLPYHSALTGQGIATALAAAAVGWAWYAPRPFAGRAAALLLAILLATPYALFYELALPAAGLVYALDAGLARSITARAVFATVWIAPLLLFVMPARLFMPGVTLALTAALAIAIFSGCTSAGIAPRRLDGRREQR